MSFNWQKLIRLLLQLTSILQFFLISVSFWKKSRRKNEKYQRQANPDLSQWIISFYLGLQDCSFNNIKFRLSFHPTISFQGYSVTLSEYHKTDQDSVKQLTWSKVREALKQWNPHFQITGLWIFLTATS